MRGVGQAPLIIPASYTCPDEQTLKPCTQNEKCEALNRKNAMSLSLRGSGSEGPYASVLLLTDLHVAADYDPHLTSSCFCRADGAQAPGKSLQDCRVAEARERGRYGCNPPTRLIEAAVGAGRHTAPEGRKPSWTLLLGGHTDHYVADNDERLALLRIALDAAVPRDANSRCAVGLGTTDVDPASAERDNAVPAGDLKEPFEREADLIKEHCHLTAAEHASLKSFGYYATNLQEAPLVRLLVLNTAIYSSSSSYLQPQGEADPFAQFQWLESQLKAAAQSGYKVYIMGHLPPVVTSLTSETLWQPKHAIRYWSMVSQYGRALAGHFFGHQHRDEFRVQLAAPLASSPPLYMFAALSPIQRTNPAYYRLDMDSTFKLLDVHSFFANISEALSDFRPGYSARADFGLLELTNRRYENLARSFANGDDQLWQKFFAASVVENLGGNCDTAQSLNPVDCSGCTGSCRQAAVCTLLYGVSESGIAACLQDALWQVAKPAWVWYADRRVAAVCLFVFIVLSLFQWRRRIQQSRALELPAPHEEVLEPVSRRSGFLAGWSFAMQRHERTKRIVV
eukprot:s702_g4.t1